MKQYQGWIDKGTAVSVMGYGKRGRRGVVVQPTAPVVPTVLISYGNETVWELKTDVRIVR